MKKTTKQNIKLSPKDASLILRLEAKTETSIDRLDFICKPIKPNESMFTLKKGVIKDVNKLEH